MTMTTTDTPILGVRDLKVSYRVYEGMLEVLDGIDLTLRPGEKVGLVGESGCGKTTTLLTILGLLPPEAIIERGQVFLAGQEQLTLDPALRRASRTTKASVIFQDPSAALNPVFTIGQQLEDIILHATRAAGIRLGKKAIRDRSIEAIRQAQLPDPERILTNYPVQLSGGMRQRVCIAMALATPSEIILADEPGTSLDVTIQDQIYRLLKGLVDESGKSILLVTHSLGVVREWTDRVYVMYAGSMIESRQTADLFGEPLHPYTKGLLNAIPRFVGEKHFKGIPGRVIEYIDPPAGCRFHTRCSVALEPCDSMTPKPVALRGDGLIRCHRFAGDTDLIPAGQVARAEEAASAAAPSVERPEVSSLAVESTLVVSPSERKTGESLVRVCELKKYFPAARGVVKAVDGIDLEVRSGETLGLVGESGSGKSTAAYVVIGFTRPTAGEVFYRDRLVDSPTLRKRMFTGKEMQIVFQDPLSSLNPRKTVGQILEMPLRVGRVSPRQRKARVRELLDDVGLPESFLSKYPRKIGGGEQQLVGVARALATSPSLIVLDEPTSSLDVSMQANIITLLARLQKQMNLAYVFITHDLSLMRNVADRVAIMYLGRIQEVAEAERFFANSLHPYTRMLLSAIPVVSEEEAQAKPPKSESRGEIGSPINPPTGCRFHPRCSQCLDRCATEEPRMHEVKGNPHTVRCHLYESESPGQEG